MAHSRTPRWEQIHDAVASGCMCHHKDDSETFISYVRKYPSEKAGKGAPFHTLTECTDREHAFCLSILQLIGEYTLKLGTNSEKGCRSIIFVFKQIVSSEVIQKLVDFYFKTSSHFLRYSCCNSLVYLTLSDDSSWQKLLTLLKIYCQSLENLDAEKKKAFTLLLVSLFNAFKTGYDLCHPHDSVVPPECPSSSDCIVELAEEEAVIDGVAGIFTNAWTSLEKSCQEISSDDIFIERIYRLLFCIMAERKPDGLFDLVDLNSLLGLSLQRPPFVSKVCLDLLDLVLSVVTEKPDFKSEDISLSVSATTDIVTKSITNNWLDGLTFRTEACGFIGTSTSMPQETACSSSDLSGDMPLLRKVVIIALKSSIVLLKKEDMASVLKIVKKTFEWAQKHTFKTDTFAEWLIQVFSDQDDQLVETMLLLLMIYIEMTGSRRITDYPEVSKMDEFYMKISAHKIFLQFLNSIGYDHCILIDLLTSSETNMLFYLVKYLKLVLFEWEEFAACHNVYSQDFKVEAKSEILETYSCTDQQVMSIIKSSERLCIYSSSSDSSLSLSEDDEECQDKSQDFLLDRTQGVLIRVKLKLERLADKGLITFNVSPLTNLIEACEEKFEKQLP